MEILMRIPTAGFLATLSASAIADEHNGSKSGLMKISSSLADLNHLT